MANFLKQSTAVTLNLGPFVDSTDGVTAETGLTISQADVRLSKNGAAFAQKNDATSATHQENGWYSVPLNTTDTGTVGQLVVAVAESGALPVWERFLVVPANVYDALMGADLLDVSVTQFGGTAITQSGGRPEVNVTHAAGTAWLSGAITAAAFASDAFTAAKFAADVGQEFADALLDRTAGVETGLTVRQHYRLEASVLFAKASGLGTTTAVFRDIGDTKDRVTATVDAQGNRTAVTTDAT